MGVCRPVALSCSSLSTHKASKHIAFAPIGILECSRHLLAISNSLRLLYARVDTKRYSQTLVNTLFGMCPCTLFERYLLTLFIDGVPSVTDPGYVRMLKK